MSDYIYLSSSLSYFLYYHQVHCFYTPTKDVLNSQNIYIQRIKNKTNSHLELLLHLQQNYLQSRRELNSIQASLLTIKVICWIKTYNLLINLFYTTDGRRPFQTLTLQNQRWVGFETVVNNYKYLYPVLSFYGFGGLYRTPS